MTEDQRRTALDDMNGMNWYGSNISPASTMSGQEFLHKHWDTIKQALSSPVASDPFREMIKRELQTEPFDYHRVRKWALDEKYPAYLAFKEGVNRDVASLIAEMREKLPVFRMMKELGGAIEGTAWVEEHEYDGLIDRDQLRYMYVIRAAAKEYLKHQSDAIPESSMGGPESGTKGNGEVLEMPQSTDPTCKMLDARQLPIIEGLEDAFKWMEENGSVRTMRLEEADARRIINKAARKYLELQTEPQKAPAEQVGPVEVIDGLDEAIDHTERWFHGNEKALSSAPYIEYRKVIKAARAYAALPKREKVDLQAMKVEPRVPSGSPLNMLDEGYNNAIDSITAQFDVFKKGE